MILHLIGKVQEEIKRMEELGVISPIEDATECPSGKVNSYSGEHARGNFGEASYGAPRNSEVHEAVWWAGLS